MGEVSCNFKFGILYCKEGQTTEEQIFSNTSGSPAYEKFLECIGDKIPLQGWKKYLFISLFYLFFFLFTYLFLLFFIFFFLYIFY